MGLPTTPQALSIPIAENNAQWNDNPGVECPAHFAGVQVHLYLKGWSSFQDESMKECDQIPEIPFRSSSHAQYLQWSG